MKKLFVIGIGPGGQEFMTNEAAAALDAADLICGYSGYVELIRDRYPEKEFYATPMTQEQERCLTSLQRAQEGRTVAMVCSGDPGVYGMASPILELSDRFPEVEIEIVAGVTAALSGSALLGAPLTHDFAVISLSNLLTDWQLILKRLTAAASADFVICLYNPSSKHRADNLKICCERLLEQLPPDRVCGWVRNIGREGQELGTLTLSQLKDKQTDMFTTIFIGNSTTKMINGRMVTPRGYMNKRG